MDILVLGGTGAIGIELVRILSENKSNRITVTSREVRHCDQNNVKYIKGDAKNTEFLFNILQDNFYDVIVDFMIYSTKEFEDRIDRILRDTSHYIFLSSSRVYADSEQSITEESDRLLDVCCDQEYLITDEYALTKARQENILYNMNEKNWTIIRPYITYNSNRLQLGFYEKEHWLYRALQHRTIVFGQDIASKETTLTSGEDVAMAMADIIDNGEGKGRVYHITHSSSIKWERVLEIYLDEFEAHMGWRPKVKIINNSNVIGKILNKKWQIKYDRMYNRRFDNSKISSISSSINNVKSVEEGLKNAICEFFNNGCQFKEIVWKFEGYADKVSDERTNIAEIVGIKNKLKYLFTRYTKFFE